MAIYKIAATVILAGVLLIPTQSKAIEPLSGDELLSLCKGYKSNPDSSDSLQCARYIKGFIDGAVAVDASVTLPKDGEQAKKSFSERAFATRIGKSNVSYGRLSNFDFCLGQPVQMREVVLNVIADVKAGTVQTELAMDMVYQSLRSHYPCN